MGKSVISADKNVVRVWEANSGRGITSIQPPAGGINDVLVWKDSGLIMMACDSPKMLVRFESRELLQRLPIIVIIFAMQTQSSCQTGVLRRKRHLTV